MRLSRKVQYGLLLVFDLLEHGKQPLSAVASRLSLSYSFLQQVANELRKCGVLRSTKGRHGGGYEVQGHTSASTIVGALEGPTKLLTTQEQDKYLNGTPAEKALAQLSLAIGRRLHDELTSLKIGVGNGQ